MNYLTSKELSEKWGIGQCRIIRLAREGRIEGAKQFGKNWMFPEDAVKPKDGRTKCVEKEETAADIFRFPLFVDASENEFNPPLSEEEVKLRNAQIAFYGCEFEKAQAEFALILKETEDIHHKIISLFYLCSISIEAFGGVDTDYYYTQLQLIFADDFPHKKDMEVVFPWLYNISAQATVISKMLNIDPLYNYSPDVLPLMQYLTTYQVSEIAAGVQKKDLHIFELVCQQLTANKRYYEVCEMHLLLFVGYYFLCDDELMDYHLREGLNITQKYGFYVVPSCFESYFHSNYDAILKEYPTEFSKKIKSNAQRISKSFVKFGENQKDSKVFSGLSRRDYRFIVFAMLGRSYKEIAKTMKISERTVTNRYNEIYAKLGVSNKKELIDKINKWMKIEPNNA